MGLWHHPGFVWLWLAATGVNAWSKFGVTAALFLTAILGLAPYSLGLLW